jgi:hypothetical protein
MLARQKPQMEEVPEIKTAPVASFKAVPQNQPDWATLQAEVTAQFSQTIAYLAK